MRVPAKLLLPNYSFGPRALGVQEHARSTLLDVAALAQATSTEGDTVCRLENYTGLLTRLQKLVVTMASGYETATEDVRSLVASTLDVATQGDRTFTCGGFLSPCQLDSKIPTCHEPRGESVDA